MFIKNVNIHGNCTSPGLQRNRTNRIYRHTYELWFILRIGLHGYGAGKFHDKPSRNCRTRKASGVNQFEPRGLGTQRNWGAGVSPGVWSPRDTNVQHKENMDVSPQEERIYSPSTHLPCRIFTLLEDVLHIDEGLSLQSVYWFKCQRLLETPLKTHFEAVFPCRLGIPYPSQGDSKVSCHDHYPPSDPDIESV